MKNKDVYLKYSKYLYKKYGEKVYKLPINLNISCPNRDGTIGTLGCYFCSDIGTGFESLNNELSVNDQLKTNMAYIGKKYHANKFIAYFQNYTNTHMPIEKFEKYMLQACIENIVEIDVSTRPDCISKPYLDVLKKIHDEKKILITVELGLQTTNDKTLLKINRGHNVNDFINAVNLIKQYPFEICTHLILNLPGDNDLDAVNSAKLMNELSINEIKLHALYIAKNTVFEKLYLQGDIKICSMEDYVDRVVLFLEHLNSNIAIQRLVGRAPKEVTVFCNWDNSWWKIQDMIENRMIKLNTHQGKCLEGRD